MIELCCEYFSVHCIWLYVIIMSCTSFWVSLLSIVCLNIKDFFARSRHHILSSIYSNRIRTHNHLVHKQMLKPSVRPAKWFSCVVSTYLYCAFGCFFLSCHIWVSEWVHTLELPYCQGTPYSKQARYLKSKWLQVDSNSSPVAVT